MPAKRQTSKVAENVVVDDGDVDDLIASQSEDVAEDDNGSVVESEDESGNESGSDDDEDFGVEKDEEEDEDEDEVIHGEEGDEDEDVDEEDEDDSDEDGGEDEVDSSVKRGGAGKQMTKGKKASSAKPQEPEDVQYGIDSDDEGEVEFEKFEEDTRDQYLLNFHPESRAVNFDEVKSLCKVVRDDDGDIIDPFHTTIPIMTKYEKARILGLRAKQLNSNIKPMVPLRDYVIDSYRIAELELEEKVIPFIIRRPLPDGRSEYWRIQDLTCVY